MIKKNGTDQTIAQLTSLRSRHYDIKDNGRKGKPR